MRQDDRHNTARHGLSLLGTGFLAACLVMAAAPAEARLGGGNRGEGASSSAGKSGLGGSLGRAASGVGRSLGGAVSGAGKAAGGAVSGLGGSVGGSLGGSLSGVGDSLGGAVSSGTMSSGTTAASRTAAGTPAATGRAPVSANLLQLQIELLKRGQRPVGLGRGNSGNIADVNANVLGRRGVDAEAAVGTSRARPVGADARVNARGVSATADATIGDRRPASRSLADANVGLNALGPRGLANDTRATLGGRQAADVASRTTLGGPRGVRAVAGAEVGGGTAATVGLGIGIGGGIGGPGGPGGPGTPGGPGGPSAGGPGAAPGAVSQSSDMAAKKLRCTGVLSEPRAYDAGIVALCRDLVGG